MSEFDESTIRAFIEDSLEHLDGITDDLLRIEEEGAGVDPELVNEVFRAIHSIKGGAGFLGFDRITELAHGMENVLNMVRNEGLVLTGTRTSVLLQAADALTEMLEDSASSNDREIGEHLTALERIVEGDAPEDVMGDGAAPSAPLEEEGEKVSGSIAALETSPEEAAAALETMNYLYLVEYRKMEDIAGRGLNEDEVLGELRETGEVLESLDTGERLVVLFATTIDPEVITALIEVEEGQLREIAPEELEGGSPAPGREEEGLAEATGDLIEADFEAEFQDETDGDAATEEGDADLPPEAQLIADGHAGKTDEEMSPEALLGRDMEEGDEGSTNGRSAPLEEERVDEEVGGGTTALSEEGDEGEPVGPIKRPATAVKEERSAPIPIPPAGAVAEEKGSPTPSKAHPVESSLRVHVGLLDRLMNLAGELVLTRNRLVQVVGAGDMQGVEATAQSLDQVTTELQEAVVSTRMQPIGNVFNRFRRVVRDLARELGKEVALTIQGEEVDLDKGIIEALGDPLTHLVRNAMDHGIERPEERRQLGKPVPASLRISAFHEAGQVVIEVIDDGRGIDPKRVRDKGLALGLIDPVQAGVMGDKELVKLIFHPGFSTAETVSGISGRGVGMDVVHTNLTKLGGVVDVDTEVGKGTTIRVKLPLTLAIIPSLLVATGEEQYAIPQVNLAELVRVPARRMHEQIQEIGGALVLRLRGRLLPLIGLRRVLGEEEEEVLGDTAYILVLEAGDFRYGLIVDEPLDSREIVVKSLDHDLSDCRIYAGATILGDGRVALILDVVGLRNLLELQEVEDPEEEEEEEAVSSDAHMLLLARNAADEQFAVPARLVSRIERIGRQQIETAGDRTAMQYRGRHLVLFSIEQAARVKPRAEREELFVIVFKVADREMGLLVSEIIDIVIDQAEIETEGFGQPGIIGSTILGGETTLVIDLYELVRTIEPEWIEKSETRLRGDATILVAEDTPFFRNQFARILGSAGYRTVLAEDGEAALRMLESRREEIGMVITDIEMPRLDGLGLTRRIRADARTADLPVIAVTSLSGEEHEKRGLAAGVDEYLIKLDREQILRAVHHYLEKGRKGA